MKNNLPRKFDKVTFYTRKDFSNYLRYKKNKNDIFEIDSYDSEDTDSTDSTDSTDDANSIKYTNNNVEFSHFIGRKDEFLVRYYITLYMKLKSQIKNFIELE